MNMNKILDEITKEINELTVTSSLDDIHNIKERIRNNDISKDEQKDLSYILGNKLEKLASAEKRVELHPWSDMGNDETEEEKEIQRKIYACYGKRPEKKVEAEKDTKEEKEETIVEKDEIKNIESNDKSRYEALKKIRDAKSIEELNELSCNLVNNFDDRETRKELNEEITKRIITLKNKKMRIYITAGAIVLLLGFGAYKLINSNIYANKTEAATNVEDQKDTFLDKLEGNVYNYTHYDYDRTEYVKDKAYSGGDYDTNPYSNIKNTNVDDTLYGSLVSPMDGGGYVDVNKIISENKLKDEIDTVNDQIKSYGWRRININSIDAGKRDEMATKFFNLSQVEDGEAGKYISRYDSPIDKYNCMSYSLTKNTPYIMDGGLQSGQPTQYGMEYWLKQKNISYNDIFDSFESQQQMIAINKEKTEKEIGKKISLDEYMDKYYYTCDNFISKNLYKELDEIRATLFCEFEKEQGIGDYFYLLVDYNSTKQILLDQENSNSTQYVPFKDRLESRSYKFN